MSKANYIPWSSWEEQALPDWLSRNDHLSWEEKSEKYRRVFGLPRGPESLRGKYNQLLKGIYRRRSISARLSQRRRKHALTASRQRPLQSPVGSSSTSVLNLRAPDPRTRQMFQQFHPEERLTKSQRRSCKYKQQTIPR